MTSAAVSHPVAPEDRVVLAWEPSDVVGDAQRLAAIDALAGVASRCSGTLLLTLDFAVERLFGRIVERLASHGVRVLPLVEGEQAASGRPKHPGAAEMLRMLASAKLLAEWDGERYIGVDAEPDFELAAVAADLRRAIGDPERPLHFGWLRRRSVMTQLPTGYSFAFDWPPYGPRAQPGEPAVDTDFFIVAAEGARLYAGDSLIAPSVPWAATESMLLPRAGIRLTGLSDLKLAYAVDSARRFVCNRAGNGMPFWVLRVQFDPERRQDNAALLSIPAAVTGARTPSGGKIKAPIFELPPDTGARIAVVVHLYYPELWGELSNAIVKIPEPFDVFVSCPLPARDAVASMVRHRFPAAAVSGVPNLGRDILPFLHWLRTPGIQRYQYVLKLHSKKSVHLIDATQTSFGGGGEWRRRSLGGLVASEGHVRVLLDAFDKDHSLGIAAPAGLLYDQLKWRCETADLGATLRARLNMDAPLAGCFAAGTMFWARMEALASLATASVQLFDFELEAGQIDGTLHHAWERMFALVAAANGYRTVDTASRSRGDAEATC